MGWINLPVAPNGTSAPQVATYGDLPNAANYSGQLHIVIASTGIFPFRKSKGFYYSDGTSWIYLADIVLPGTGLSATYDPNSVTLTPETVAGIVVPFDCASNAGVGALVQMSDTTDDFAEVVSDNYYGGLVIGAIESKPTATTCQVRLLGARSGFSGFVKNRPVYVSAAGTPTTTVPTTGNLQKIGVSLSSTKFLINPATEKVIRP